MRKWGWILVGVLVGWLLAPAVPSARQFVQNVLLHAAGPTALTATNGNLNVTCQ